jgi:NAD(P)-dependent dehydrogenase (short-subunit alcohol dehydrogenase family)
MLQRLDELEEELEKEMKKSTEKQNDVKVNDRGGWSPEELETFVQGLPIRRLTDPMEIAQAVLFLASDESEYITGVAFPVDGGRLPGYKAE